MKNLLPLHGAPSRRTVGEAEPDERFRDRASSWVQPDARHWIVPVVPATGAFVVVAATVVDPTNPASAADLALDAETRRWHAATDADDADWEWRE